jgi:hypothetical protein
MEPDESGAGAPAVEVATERPLPSFVHGALVGIAMAAVLAHVWLAVQLGPVREAYRGWGAFRPESLGGPTYPLVLHPGWLWGVPAAGLVALIALVVRRPRSLVAYGALAVLLVVTAIATWHLASAPFNELASNIQG